MLPLLKMLAAGENVGSGSQGSQSRNIGTTKAKALGGSGLILCL